MIINVLTKRPGGFWERHRMEDDLQTLQDFVGGDIETVTLEDDIVLICNKLGRLLHLPYNCSMHGMSFVGNLIMCKATEEGFCSVWKEDNDERLYFADDIR